jgi:hypothetical protein
LPFNRFSADLLSEIKIEEYKILREKKDRRKGRKE